MELKGKRALVTGGAIRIGRAVALALARAGCSIALHYGRSLREARATAAELRALGVDCSLHQADLGSAKAVQALAKEVLRHRQGCQILVNSASVFPASASNRPSPRISTCPTPSTSGLPPC